MKKVEVVTIVGTRPEIIRLSRVLPKLDVLFDHKLIHTGQNYDFELNEIFFSEMRLRRPDVTLSAAGTSAAETIGGIIMQVDRVLAELKPDAVLLLGDTNSCLSAIPAKRRRIPIFHMEAGNRCFDDRVPEEINRRIVDHIADINLTYSSIAREYLMREGIAPDTVIKVGSPMYEVLQHYRSDIDRSHILSRLGLEQGAYFVVSAHREENIDNETGLRKLASLMNELAEKFAVPVVVSTHPRTRKRIESAGVEFHPGVRLMKPLGFFDYVRLEMGARVVLSDSGTITEESSILGFPAVNLRETHERLEGMEEAAVMMTGLESSRVMQAIEVLRIQAENAPIGGRTVPDYSVPNVSDKVARIILSYVDSVQRRVWRTDSPVRS